jgi:hypothetical protein
MFLGLPTSSNHGATSYYSSAPAALNHAPATIMPASHHSLYLLNVPAAPETFPRHRLWQEPLECRGFAEQPESGQPGRVALALGIPSLSNRAVGKGGQLILFERHQARSSRVGAEGVRCLCTQRPRRLTQTPKSRL